MLVFVCICGLLNAASFRVLALSGLLGLGSGRDLAFSQKDENGLHADKNCFVACCVRMKTMKAAAWPWFRGLGALLQQYASPLHAFPGNKVRVAPAFVAPEPCRMPPPDNQQLVGLNRDFGPLLLAQTSPLECPAEAVFARTMFVRIALHIAPESLSRFAE